MLTIYHKAASRDRAHFLCFTLTVHPHLITPRFLDIGHIKFPNQQTTTVYARAIINIQTPKIVLAFYSTQAEVNFDICVKITRNNAAPDPEKYEQQIHEITTKTKLYACKQYVQKSYV
jgi:hypothetical protein